MMLPEALAIVFSPITAEKYKIFRVKDTKMEEIKKCNLESFHEHPDEDGSPAFEECHHSRVVKGKDHGIKMKVIDLT